MAKFNQFEQVWMVKSAGMVLGPLTIAELSKAVQEKRISLLDEVKPPLARWIFLREQPELADIVKSFRDKEVESENTNITKTRTKTQTITEASQEELTPQPIAFDKKPKLPQGLDSQSQPADEVGNVPMQEKKSAASMNVNGMTKGAVPMPLAQKKIRALPKVQNTSVSVWWIAGIVITFVLGLSFYTLNIKNSEQLKTTKAQISSAGSNVEIVKEALRYKELGFHKKSAERYHQASLVRDLDFSFQVEMLPVLAQDSRYSDEVIRIGSLALSDNKFSLELKQKILNWISLAYIKKGQLASAESNYAKMIDITVEKSISVNRAIAKFLSQDYEYVLQEFDDLWQSSNGQPNLLLIEAFSIFESKHEVSEAKVSKVLSLLEQNMSTNVEFETEFILAQIALLVKSGKGARANALISELETELLEGEHFARDLNFSDEMTRWGNLNRYCKNIAQKMNNTAQAQLLMLICESRSESPEIVLKNLRQAQQAIKGIKADNLKITLFIKMGQINEAEKLLGASENTFGPLLRAKICLEKKDYDCAVLNAERMLKTESTNLEAYNILARSLLKQVKRPMAIEKVRAGLKVSAHYLPLVALREELIAE